MGGWQGLDAREQHDPARQGTPYHHHGLGWVVPRFRPTGSPAATPDMVAAAFSGSAIGAPPTSTTLLDIDSTLNSLASQDPDGSELNTVGLLGVDTTPNVGFDLVSDATGVDRGYAALQRPGSSRSELFRIELISARAVRIGNIGTGPVVKALTSLRTS